MEETAYFVNHPRRVSDLRQPHLPEAEQTYAIVQTITLRPIDYENSLEGGVDGLDQGAAHASVLERDDALDGGATG